MVAPTIPTTPPLCDTGDLPFQETQCQETASTCSSADPGKSSSFAYHSLAARTATATATTPLSPVRVRRPRRENAQRQEWWRKSVVKRSVGPIQDAVAKVIDQSELLRQCSNRTATPDIAVFHRREIILRETILGSGGFSEVYEIAAFELDPEVSARCTREQQRLREACVGAATDGNGRHRFALKHLRARMLLSPSAFQRAATDLALEAAYMSALQHPNILAVRGLPIDGIASYAEGCHDGFFLITDRLTCTLGDCIAGDWRHGSSANQPSIEERVEYALQIAKALQYLHSKNICFRDLKPNNVGLTTNGTVQLFDFGLCRELPLSPSSDTDELFEMSEVGTRRYMACEVIAQGRYNCKADVYSWAMVLWELLTLRKPYERYGVEEHTTAVCWQGERPPVSGSWPRYLQDVLRNAWCSDTANRWSAATVVRNLLRAPQRDPESPVCVMQAHELAADDTGSDAMAAAALHRLLALPELRSFSERCRGPPRESPSSDGDDDDRNEDEAPDIFKLFGLQIECLDDRVEVMARDRLEFANVPFLRARSVAA